LAKNNRLTLCMIVKDEETFVGQCLESVRGFVDEMIVVDTGSVDRTKDICLEKGAKLFEYVWNGSFADARNFGLAQAAGNWILWMDADEMLEVQDAELWRNALRSGDQPIFGIPVVNYYGERPVDPDKAYLATQFRIFRNGLGLKFINDIHEQLNVQEALPGCDKIGLLPAVLHHYGYLDDVTADKRKHERNMAMLQREQEKMGYSPWIDYHLASELYRVRDYGAAFEAVNVAMRRFIEQGVLPPSLLYKLKYDTLLSNGSFEGAWPGIEKAIALYPAYVDLHLFDSQRGGQFFCRALYPALRGSAAKRRRRGLFA